MLIRTHIPYCGNSKKISQVSLLAPEGPISLVICSRNFSHHISVDFVHEHINEESKIYLIYSHFDEQDNSRMIAIE